MKEEVYEVIEEIFKAFGLNKNMVRNRERWKEIIQVAKSIYVK